jgi:4-hydroxybenzoate polyprenyltransferase
MMIALTMYLSRYCIIRPFFITEGVALIFSDLNFFLLVLSTVLIAMGGYVINDYFDLRIDHINKPDKIVLGRIIPRRRAILMHQIFTFSGVLIGFYLSYVVRSLWLPFLFVVIATTLWLYSLKFKQTYLFGNIVVALLSSLVILMVWLFEFYALKHDGVLFITNVSLMKLLLWGFIFFAFINSLIREIVKDMEDIDGDRRAGSLTMPVVSGVKATKIFVNILIVLEMAIMSYILYLLFENGFTLLLIYYSVAIMLLLLFAIIKTTQSKLREDFHFVSSLFKIIMVAGIFSMILIYISFLQ